MPTYDYQCKQCEHRFEEFQSMKDKPLRKCPKCGKLALERLIGTGAGIIFKGSGFYETDYRSDSYKKAAESDKKSANGTSGDKKKDGKSDSKSSSSVSSSSATSATSTGGSCGSGCGCSSAS